MENVDQLRLVLKVARLYHTHGRRQADIAEQLQVSQSRVSRLLSQAEESGIVRTVVALRPEIHSDLEERLEERYGLNEVHVIDPVSTGESELTRDLAFAMASVLEQMAFKVTTMGFTSWSRTLRQMVGRLQPLRTRAERVVELVGDLGPPDVQHQATGSTERLADLVEGVPVFLRTPGVVPDRGIRQALLDQDAHTREALKLLDDLDLALVGIGTCDMYPPLRAGDNYFTEEQLARVRAQGAVGQLCLRFVDAEGAALDTPLDDLVLGITTEQLRSAKRRWAVAGGPAKHLAIHAALSGGWVHGFVTDIGTARFLLADDTEDSAVNGSAKARRARPSTRGQLQVS